MSGGKFVLRLRPGFAAEFDVLGVLRYRPICHVFGPLPGDLRCYEGDFVDTEAEAEAIARSIAASIRAELGGACD